MDIVDPVIDFLHLARSMGIPARHVDRAGDITAAVVAGIRSESPNLIEVPIASGQGG